MIGETINGFLLEKKLYVASTGTVYCARDTMLDVPKAIKIIHPQLAENKVTLQRFRLALQAWARLDYPTFVPIYSAIEDNNALGFITNFVEGKPLAKIIKKQGKLGISQSVDYFLQIAKALSFSHRIKIMHRKLSTRNILVCKDESIKLVGLGALRDGDIKKITPAHLCIGKPQYMAPEQFAGNYSEQTDQYTLGVILYEMITGKRPFVAKNLRTLYQMHMQRTPEAPKKLTPELDNDLQEIILKMLSKKPENRYSSIDRVMEAVLMATDRFDVSEDISVQSLMYRGRHALERRKLENAIYFFNKILSIYGKETPYYQEAQEKRQEASSLYKEEEDIRRIRDLFMESLICFDEEEISEAREYIIEILQIMRDHPNSSRIKGIRMDIAREMPEILAEASNWHEQVIEESNIFTEKGKQLTQEGHFEEAIDMFEKALARDPQNYSARQQKSNAQKKRKIALVAKCYCNAQAAFKHKDYNQAISLFEKVLQLDEEHAKAKKYLEITKGKKEKEEKKRKDIDDLYQEALELYEKWQYTEALKKFETVLKLEPDHSEAENFMELTRLRLDEDTKIEEIGLFYQNGVSFYETRKLREAIACFNRVLIEIPTHKKAIEYKKLAEEALERDKLWERTFGEAVDLFNENRYSEALERLEYLQKIDEHNPEVQRYQRLCRELIKNNQSTMV